MSCELLSIGAVIVILAVRLWPSKLFNTPLAALTLGGLLGGLFSLSCLLVFGMLLVGWMIRLPKPGYRSPMWSENWIVWGCLVGVGLAYAFAGGNAAALLSLLLGV